MVVTYQVRLHLCFVAVPLVSPSHLQLDLVLPVAPL